MPYSETHSIVIGPLALPLGVSVTTDVVAGGQTSITITATTGTDKADTIALLQTAFAELMTAASAEGVGEPVFGPAPAPAPTTTPGPTTA